MAPPRATMDFFAAQAAARRRTAVLVVWFALAWAGTIALVWAGLGLLLGSGAAGAEGRLLAFTPGFLAAVAAGVTLVTAAGSAFHAARLARDGPHAVAAMVGGVAVDRATADPAERRLVNVVEEMAIASGLPVPAIYVLPDEPGINAFAAGFTPERAVVAVTRGAADALTRDELQGVVAHEFSHLLNADARLNLRLVALIGGITVLALIGRILVRDVAGSGGRRSRGGGRVRLFAFLAGACLWIAGSVGAFFGRVIRAAVSRQREFLADAAAVQLTRNPDGLAGALAKIGAQGSAVASAGAPEVSHLFFANGLGSRWLATHPPIDERIRRIAPRLLGGATRAAAAGALADAAREKPAARVENPMLAAASAGLAAARTLAATAGRPDARHVGYAAELLARLPPDVAVAARAVKGARALVTALLADADPTAREVQLGHLPDGAVRAEVARLAAALAWASREDRTAILDLALPALDGLSREEAAALLRDLAALAAADGRTTVFEWAVQRIVQRRVAPRLGAARPPALRARTVEDVQVEALELLSVLAWLGARWPLRARGDGRGIAGPAVALALFIGVTPALPEVGIWLALGGAAIALVGLLDDLLDLSPWQKLLGQSVGAALATVALSDAVPALLGVAVPIGAARVVVTFLWILTLTNAVNLIDGLDGLAVGVLIPSLAGLVAVAALRGTALEGMALIAALAALAGFWPANVRPARLLLGDTGAELLGYLLAVFTLTVLQQEGAGWAVLPAVLLAAVPLADTLFAVARRLARRRPVFERDEGHIHHRLAARFGGGRAVALLVGVSLLASGAAVLLWRVGV